MGSELGHVSMYYTDDEPPIDQIGKRRHFFGKPSLKGIAAVNQGMGGISQQRPNQFMDAGSPMLGQNVPKDEAIFKNPEAFEALKKLN